MKRQLISCLLILASLALTSCAAVNLKSQLAPNTNITKNDALFLQEPANSPIGHQKYIAALKEVLTEQGFNTVHKKSQARFIMDVSFKDFQADVYQSVPKTQTTVYRGSIGTSPISGSSTTISNERVRQQIPTHNSTISVINKTSGQVVWEVSMAKSFDTYNHKALKQMIAKMLSLYGEDGDATEIVSDKFRW